MLPVMVCLDGYILTHGLEPVDIPSQEQVDKFLPEYKAPFKLDVENPMSLGFLADPDYYMECRVAIQETHKEVLKLIPKVCDDFKKVFGRQLNGLVESYKVEDADSVIVALGSVVGTIKEAVDDLRKAGKKVGVLKIVTHRPFPAEAIYNALKKTKQIAVLEKAISLGNAGPVFTEIKSLFQEKPEHPKVSGFVIGLGGRDITMDSIKGVFTNLDAKQTDCEFIEVKKELLLEKI
jgi:pyruvate ferredoxin oxidoreductase alpha subunit